MRRKGILLQEQPAAGGEARGRASFLLLLMLMGLEAMVSILNVGVYDGKIMQSGIFYFIIKKISKCQSGKQTSKSRLAVYGWTGMEGDFSMPFVLSVERYLSACMSQSRAPKIQA